MKKTKKPIPSSRPVALVTGAASSLGSAISRALAGRGMNLALHYGGSLGKTREFQKDPAFNGLETLLVQADLGKPAQMNRLIGKVIQKWGRLDVLVNSASWFKPTPLPEARWEEWENILRINTLSPAALMAAAQPWLKVREGCVVNLTDIYGEMPILKDHPAYSLSKAGLIFLTRYLAGAMGPQIRVNAVSPGVISFPPHYTRAQKKKLIEKSALQRQGTPEDIAQAVLFLVSNRFVTGQVLKVDGGRFIS